MLIVPCCVSDMFQYNLQNQRSSTESLEENGEAMILLHSLTVLSSSGHCARRLARPLVVESSVSCVGLSCDCET